MKWKTLQNKSSFRVASSKVLSRSDLQTAVVQAKSEGKIVVSTNGCFDVLHIGHIRYLQKAREFGDILVVGVNTDESVQRLKGPTRPLVPEFERAEVLAALECVDYVTVFSEDTPFELCDDIHPDVHVKGGDYVIEQMPEAVPVIKHGGRVELISLADINTFGRSTSRLIEKMNSDDE